MHFNRISIFELHDNVRSYTAADRTLTVAHKLCLCKPLRPPDYTLAPRAGQKKHWNKESHNAPSKIRF
jgi:hypothetical protein